MEANSGVSASPMLFVVDDNADACALAALLLGSYGWQVRTFNDAITCLEAALEAPPACIVTDLQMPMTDGNQLIDTLRAAGLQVPVVVVTASPADSVAALRAAAIAAGFLNKPYEVEQLHQIVSKAVAGAQALPTIH